MLQFPDESRTRVVFGADTIEQIGTFAVELDARRALLVSDPHIVAAGHVARAVRSLEAAHVAVALYDRVRENPTTDDVASCLELAQTAEPDIIIGLGGGSSLDTAKGCNFLLTNGGRMQDYWGVGKATHDMLPLIAVPTTAGTGSECQSFALIADIETHQKMACGDPKAAPAVSILDPTLTVTQPRTVTANTGVDAMAHALETAVTNKRNDLSLRYAREAFRVIQANLPRVFDNPTDIAARGQMLLGAAYSGTAIENSMLGAAHSAANPLTAHFGVVHGQAVGVMLPAVIRFNAEDETAHDLYVELARHAGLEPTVEALVERVEELLNLAGMPRTLTDRNVTRESIPQLADEAATQWTAQFNPRPLTAADFVAMYESTYETSAVQ
ncbi:MAG: iron-containing alcohol dehydrogenase [Phycisphaera sp.]|nr:iron-containing alcohol dehydrogenase [Phycisphaera sp.]